MTGFEYKVVPAPMHGLKAKGVKGTPARFAHALETMMNEFGAQGWEYQRADALPVEERRGLTGRTTTVQNMLVFRRAIVADVAIPTPVAPLIKKEPTVQARPVVVQNAPPITDAPDTQKTIPPAPRP